MQQEFGTTGKGVHGIEVMKDFDYSILVNL